MKFVRLRLVGFKSFVEPTEFPIEAGLSGVVGPNGCGKSNLVEALRWVMGESSYKNMRASGMEDVIFSGSGSRPARSMAEVALTLDNSDHLAPAQFNAADTLEVTRRIERDDGSTYRVNGKEVRARDVQLLFADAATGARSPALVRQGQISEIISARPQSRRRILEDAAGIAGLHTRRHEAELRLKAADENLLRLEDVLREIAQQADGLSRQARQAERYRALSAQIREAEQTLARLAIQEADAAIAEARREIDLAVRDLADATARQAETARLEGMARLDLTQAQEADAAAGAALARLRRGLDDLEAEQRRNRQRAEDLARRLGELEGDLARNTSLVGDADEALARLAEEHAAVDAAMAGDSALLAELAAARDHAEQRRTAAEAAHQTVLAEHADLAARRAARERDAREATESKARLEAEAQALRAEQQRLGLADPTDGIAASQQAVETAERACRVAEQGAERARQHLVDLREREHASRQELNEAERQGQRIETEIATLRKLLATPGGGRWPAAVEQIAVEAGYETALGAALGDDLDAALGPGAPVHWRLPPDIPDSGEDPQLPADATPLSAHVTAPAALARRLAQIGLVPRDRGRQLALALKPGQRLVSREGDLWRWDGLAAAAEAPSAAARRLAERNRLAAREQALVEAQDGVRIRRGVFDEHARAVRAGQEMESTALAAARAARAELDRCRASLLAAERAAASTAARRASLAEALARLASAVERADQQRALAHADLSAMALPSALQTRQDAALATMAAARAEAGEARAQLDAARSAHAARARQLETLQTEQARWQTRARDARAQAAELAARQRACSGDLAALAAAPDTYLVQRRALVARIEQAEAARRMASDRLAEAQRHHAACERAAREALVALGTVREARGGADARLAAACARRDMVAQGIMENLDLSVAELMQPADAQPADAQPAEVQPSEARPSLAGGAMPVRADIERRLQTWKGERDRLGAVNLLAVQELEAVNAKHAALVAERDDLSQAIRKLRQAIGALNREGRERLLAAFEVVNGHFKSLFGVLFGGGEAELTLVDAEDPLEAGLDILARPPGKKPQTMTLLSGGEQALTAIALIFAVFLTNPSPICVLDEVDAPLDDANVERYCDLLRDMVERSSTRFLVITHNPITMARMDRLFGVTMAERGVSQLVSVDLQTAERLRERA